MKRFYNKYKPYVLAALAVLIAVFIWFGFDHTYGKVMQCKVSSSAWVTAEYSETSASVDANGNVSVDTDYWSEPASPVFEAVTVNGELVGVYGNFKPIETGSQYFKPPMPHWDGSMASDFNFDSFAKHRENKLIVSTHLTIEDVPSTFTSSASKNPACINKLDAYIQVKTWYGITYESDF